MDIARLVAGSPLRVSPSTAAPKEVPAVLPLKSGSLCPQAPKPQLLMSTAPQPLPTPPASLITATTLDLPCSCSHHSLLPNAPHLSLVLWRVRGTPWQLTASEHVFLNQHPS